VARAVHSPATMSAWPLPTALLLSMLLPACEAGTGMLSPDANTGASPDASVGVVADASSDPDAHVPDPERGLSAGCGKASGTGLQSRTIQIDGVDRTFLRFIPAGYKPNTPMSLVLAFHGSGGTSAAARSTFDLEGAAGGKAIIVYPQALPNEVGENRWDATNKNSVDYKLVDDIIARTEANFCIDRDRIFATGFSLGARFTSNLGCWRGDVLRAIAPVAPGGDVQSLPLTDCVGEVGIWEGLGNLDDSLHTVGATRVREYFSAANGCAATRTATTPTGCERYDGCRSEVPAVWCTYNLAHQWPSIAPVGVTSFFASFQ
jgi:polyhydroxybutyrate depolymerase